MTAIAPGAASSPDSTRQRVTHGGVGLAFVADGAGAPGAPPVVLVHGVCDDLGVMAPLAARMGGRHRTVRVDLRGHGASDAPAGDYSVATLAADVAAMCDHLAVRGAVVVGHSLGGAVAVQLAASRPELVAALVLLDGALLFRPEVAEGAAPLLEALHSPAWREALHAFVDTGFVDSDDPAVRADAHARVDGLTHHAMAGVLTAAGPWDAEPALRACRVPLLYVDSGAGLADLERLAQLCPQLETGRTVGMGHNQMLASPAQVAAMIDRFMAVHAAALAAAPAQPAGRP